MKLKEKQILPLMGAFVLSLLVLLLFSSSTSPMFDIVYSDYYNNPASTGFFVGKLWSEGVLPYRDLYVVNGPFYYVIQMLGWNLGGRTGIFVIQLICMAVGLWFLSKTVCLMTDKKFAWIVMILSALFLCGTLNGGNSPVEYCFTISATTLYLGLLCVRDFEHVKTIHLFILGLLTGVVLMTRVTGGGIVYGVFLLILFEVIREREIERKGSKIIALLLGVLSAMLPFLAYFAMQGCMAEMIDGAFVQSTLYLWMDAFSVKLFMHKMIKTVPTLLLLVMAVLFYKKDTEISRLCIAVSLGLLVFTITGQGYWYQYIPVAAAFALLLALIRRNNNVMNKWIPLSVGTVILIGIIFIPIKNYLSFVSNEGIEVYHDLIDQIDTYQEITGENSVFMVDVPAFVYLETDSVPSYYYFVQHSEYAKVKPELQQVVTEYMVNESKDGLAVIQGTGGTYLYIGNYVMTNNYNFDRTMLYVYEYMEDLDNTEEHEHSHGEE